MKVKHVLSISGGKDSTAMYLLALERGLDFVAVFADTGNEHEITLDYVRELPIKTGGPPIQWVKADFSEERFEQKREYIRNKWPEKHGISESRAVSIALRIIKSGNPFLDLCVLKGRFPSNKFRFCSQFLKGIVIDSQVFAPLFDSGYHVISWRGIRANESNDRANARLIYFDNSFGYSIYNPLVRWTIPQVINQHKRHGINLNPLYTMGFRRVGCMPCVNTRKKDILSMAQRFPEEVDRIRKWEAAVAAASPKGLATFFHAKTTPIYGLNNIDDVVEWSKTSRGGRQYDLESFLPPPACQSEWGLCE